MIQINKTVTFCILLCSFQLSAFSQTIIGKITDNKQQPIEGATVVLQQADSSYVDAVISTEDGTFTFNKQPEIYHLIIQHLLYQTKQIIGNTPNIGIIQLEPKDYALSEVVVKGERSLVKVKDGRLRYDLAMLSEKQVINNAYEALTKLPGVQENNGTLALAGANTLTVVLNGKPTTMNTEQLKTLLLNTPVNRIDKAEVMYSAPPELHVRGAVINIVLKRSRDYSFQGELNTHYRNQYFSSGGMNGNFRFSTPKMAFDVMYSANDIKKMEYMDLYSQHTLNNEVYDIFQNEQLRSKYWEHSIRTAFEYNFNEKKHLNMAYTGSYTPNQYNNSLTKGNFQCGNVDKYMDTQMHNVSLQYASGFGLEMGGDYTRYTSDNHQSLQTTYQDEGKASFSLIGGQKIDRYSIYADQKHKLSHSWEIGYGVSYRFTKDYDSQIYSDVTGDIKTSNTSANLKEQTTNFYISLSKNYAKGTSLSISATGEYYTIGSYHKWAIYPQASLTYMKTPKHIFQVSLSTDKTYPSYWDMQSSVTYLNGYTELQGTPGLRPMTAYNLNGSYILKQKYIFNLFVMHTSDYFAQAPYQSSERLALIYKNMNWNFMRMWGANIIIPFKTGNWYDTRLTMMGMQTYQRCDKFFDIPFKRKKWMFMLSLDNTFKVNKSLSFEVNGNMQTPFIQGTFDLASLFNLTAGLKWNFAKDRCSLTARCNDIFNTSVPEMKVRFKGQHLDLNNSFYSRSVSLNFSYRFGGFKKKKTKEVDTTRFGH